MHSITEKRWFLGKGKQIRHISEFDSANIGDTALTLLQVEFTDGQIDYYTVIKDEIKIASILSEGFGNGQTHFFRGTKGIFKFFSPWMPSKETMRSVKLLDTEQSNSAFYSKGIFLFKIFRRVQKGFDHPEIEILEHLTKYAEQHSEKAFFPRILGYLEYCRPENDERFALGILEEHIPDAKNVWEMFTDKENTDAEFFRNASHELGRTTAKMHQALKDLKGTPPQPETPPFDRLITLLKENGKEELVPIVQEKQLLFRQKKEIPDHPRQARTGVGNDMSSNSDSKLVPQRIHGDYHLGQLLYKDGQFIVLDFEGEPIQTLSYRRRLRSPAADIAGMLRSFAYANAVRSFVPSAGSLRPCSVQAGTLFQTSSSNNEGCLDNFETITSEAFLQGYSQETGISVEQLKEKAKPYVLSKAIYEACYELECRPDWFWIPEAALKN